MIYGGIQFLDPRRKGIAEINMATATFYRSLARARTPITPTGDRCFHRDSARVARARSRLGSRCRGAISGAYLSFHDSAVFLSTFSRLRSTLRFIATSCFSFMGVIKRLGLPAKIYTQARNLPPFKSHVDYCRTRHNFV